MHDTSAFHENTTTPRPHRTVTGRVVYNRRTHYFTIADWSRIGRKVPPPKTVAEAINTIENIFTLLQDVTNYVFGWMPQLQASKLIFSFVRPVLINALEKWVSSLDSDAVQLQENIYKVMDLLNGL